MEVVNLLDKQVQEMKLMTNEIRRLKGNWEIPFNLLGLDEEFPIYEYFLNGFVYDLAIALVCLL